MSFDPIGWFKNKAENVIVSGMNAGSAVRSAFSDAAGAVNEARIDVTAYAIRKVVGDEALTNENNIILNAGANLSDSIAEISVGSMVNNTLDRVFGRDEDEYMDGWEYDADNPLNSDEITFVQNLMVDLGYLDQEHVDGTLNDAFIEARSEFITDTVQGLKDQGLAADVPQSVLDLGLDYNPALGAQFLDHMNGSDALKQLDSAGFNFARRLPDIGAFGLPSARDLLLKDIPEQFRSEPALSAFVTIVRERDAFFGIMDEMHYEEYPEDRPGADEPSEPDSGLTGVFQPVAGGEPVSTPEAPAGPVSTILDSEIITAKEALIALGGMAGDYEAIWGRDPANPSATDTGVDTSLEGYDAAMVNALSVVVPLLGLEDSAETNETGQYVYTPELGAGIREAVRTGPALAVFRPVARDGFNESERAAITAFFDEQLKDNPELAARFSAFDRDYETGLAYFIANYDEIIDGLDAVYAHQNGLTPDVDPPANNSGTPDPSDPAAPPPPPSDLPPNVLSSVHGVQDGLAILAMAQEKIGITPGALNDDDITDQVIDANEQVVLQNTIMNLRTILGIPETAQNGESWEYNEHVRDAILAYIENNPDNDSIKEINDALMGVGGLEGFLGDLDTAQAAGLLPDARLEGTQDPVQAAILVAENGLRVMSEELAHQTRDRISIKGPENPDTEWGQDSELALQNTLVSFRIMLGVDSTGADDPLWKYSPEVKQRMLEALQNNPQVNLNAEQQAQVAQVLGALDVLHANDVLSDEKIERPWRDVLSEYEVASYVVERALSEMAGDLAIDYAGTPDTEFDEASQAALQEALGNIRRQLGMFPDSMNQGIGDSLKSMAASVFGGGTESDLVLYTPELGQEILERIEISTDPKIMEMKGQAHTLVNALDVLYHDRTTDPRAKWRDHVLEGVNGDWLPGLSPILYNVIAGALNFLKDNMPGLLNQLLPFAEMAFGFMSGGKMTLKQAFPTVWPPEDNDTSRVAMGSLSEEYERFMGFGLKAGFEPEKVSGFAIDVVEKIFDIESQPQNVRDDLKAAVQNAFAAGQVVLDRHNPPIEGLDDAAGAFADDLQHSIEKINSDHDTNFEVPGLNAQDLAEIRKDVGGDFVANADDVTGSGAQTPDHAREVAVSYQSGAPMPT